MDYWILNQFLAFESGTIQSMFKTINSSIAMSSAFSQSLKGLKNHSILVLLLLIYLIYKTIFFDFLGKVDEGNPDGVYCPHIVFIDIYSSKDKVIIFA